jgi:DNA end-binding protein Ku
LGSASFFVKVDFARARSSERSVDLYFRMLDSRDNTPVRYERVNSESAW